jgi:hypothetical protein
MDESHIIVIRYGDAGSCCVRHELEEHFLAVFELKVWTNFLTNIDLLHN